MTNYLSAFDTIKEQYDIDTLREIVEHGCSSGAANNHIYYYQTVEFFDNNEEEITDYVKDNFGSETLVELFTSHEGYLRGYKNDLVWVFIELVANTLIEQYEDITCEEMNDTFDEITSSIDKTLDQLDSISRLSKV